MRFTLADVIALACLLCCGFWFICDAALFGRIPGFDLNSYITLAENPWNFFNPSIPAVHAQRIVPTLSVWIIHSVFGFSIDSGFRIVSDISYLAFIFMFYYVLRYLKVSPIVAFSTTALTSIASWPMTYSLTNVYQACDAMVYPLTLAIILLVIKRKGDILFVASVLAILTRQNLLVLAILAHLSIYLKNRDNARHIAYVLILILIFTVTALFAGSSQIFNQIKRMATTSDFKLSYMIVAAKDVRVWTMFSPFLLVFFNARAIGCFKEYWWIWIYFLYTCFQGFGAYGSMAYWDNLSRWMMQGIFPLFLLAGLLLNDFFRDRRVLLIYGLLPFTYGTAHLSFLKHVYPSLLGHRFVTVFVILALMVWSSRLQVDAPPNSDAVII